MKNKSTLFILAAMIIAPLFSNACGSFQRYEMNLMGGVSPFVSKGDFRNDYSIGKNVGLNLAYRVCPFLSFQLRTGYSNFSVKKILTKRAEDGKVNEINEGKVLNAYNFNLSARANCYRCHNFQHYSFIGGGINIIDKNGYANYFMNGSPVETPSVTENTFGLQAGTGIDYLISKSLSINLETSCQYIFTRNSFSKNIWYMPVQLGFIYRFGKEIK